MTLEGSCDLPEIVHSALLWNSIGSVGNSWEPTGDYCPDCYVSTEEDQTLAYDPIQTYTFNFDGQMNCNIGGNFFSDGGTLSIAITGTTGSLIVCTPGANDGGDVGTYTPACSTGTPTCPFPGAGGYQSWNIGFAPSENCWEYVRTPFLAIKLGGALTECVASPVSLQASSPGPSSNAYSIGEAMIKPDVIVDLNLYPEGGRKSSTPPDHLGCILEYENENFECRLLLGETGPLAPGAQARVPLKFLKPDLIKGRLHVGDRFRLREAKYIGEGVFEEILL